MTKDLGVTGVIAKRLRELEPGAAAYDNGSIDCGAAYHKSHLWLARIAYEKGDFKTAKKEFLTAASFKSAIKQSLVGPDLYLADRFLKDKQYRVVFQYLKTCSIAWQSGILEDWLEGMKTGQMPDLQAYIL